MTFEQWFTSLGGEAMPNNIKDARAAARLEIK